MAPIVAPGVAPGVASIGAGHRVFVDGRVVGEGPGPLEVPCGRHAVKVGSGGKTQSLDLPCGGETTLTAL
ncbi:MAG: hypothetical protein NVS3B10_06560 [Polyangiales bacterium]